MSGLRAKLLGTVLERKKYLLKRSGARHICSSSRICVSEKWLFGRKISEWRQKCPRSHPTRATSSPPPKKNQNLPCYLFASSLYNHQRLWDDILLHFQCARIIWTLFPVFITWLTLKCYVQKVYRTISLIMMIMTMMMIIINFTNNFLSQKLHCMYFIVLFIITKSLSFALKMLVIFRLKIDPLTDCR